MKKLYDILTLCVFLIIIFGFSVAFVIKKDVPETADEANLQMLPALSWEDLESGKYAEKMNDYFSDQFPARTQLVHLKASIEQYLFKGENNGILIGEDGQLASREFALKTDDGALPASDCRTKEQIYPLVSAQLENMKTLSQTMAEKNIELAVITPPRTIDIAQSAFNYPESVSNMLTDIIKESVSGFNYIDMLEEYRSRYNSGEYVYYRTDHHWTTLGAYYCYKALMKSYGLESDIIPLESFDIEKAADDFYGTFSRTAGYKSTADTISFFHYNGDKYKMEVCNTSTGEIKSTTDGLYIRSYLSERDKYAAFITYKEPYTRITRADDTKREKLLVYKDSFGNALIPFLAHHFDLEIIDFSSNDPSLPRITSAAEKHSASKVLIIYNMQNLLELGDLSKLK